MIDRFEIWLSELYTYHSSNVGKGLILVAAMHILLAVYETSTDRNNVILGAHIIALSAVGAFWVMMNRLRHRHRNMLFFVVATVALPCAGFTILATMASEVAVGGLPFAYVAMALSALFIYSVILSNIPLSSIGFVLAFVCGLVPSLLADGTLTEGVQFYVIEPIGLWLTLFLVTGVVNRNIDHAHERRVEAAHSLAANLAHELRTPLTGIHVRCERTLDILSSMDHEDALPHSASLKAVAAHVGDANTVIDTVLENAATSTDAN